METSTSTSEQQLADSSVSAAKASPKRSLMAFFFAAYILQGFACAQFGMIGQPVQYFFMEGMGMNAADISFLMSAFMIPWIIKPIYGVISDSVPLFGYRRKSYLVLGSFMAAIAFFTLSMFCTLPTTILCVVITAAGMAVSTALMVALAVERGREDGRARDYFRIQEMGYYITNIVVVIGAGYICHILSPEQALRTSSLIAGVCALILSLFTLTRLEETRVVEKEKVAEKIKTIYSSVTDSRIRHILLLTCLWNFTMAYGVSLYYHESKTLLFSQSFIGQLTAWTAFGTLCGAFFYNRLIKGVSNLKQTVITAIVLLVSTLAYTLLSTPVSAVLLEIFHGFSTMFVVLTTYGLASEVCKEGAEASTMAVMVCVLNLSTCSALFIGGQLFTHVLDMNYTALVLVAAIPAILSLLFISQVYRKSGKTAFENNSS